MFKYIFFWVFFQLLGLLKAYYFDVGASIIYDLEGSGSGFMNDVNSWFQSSYRTSGVKTSTCQGNTLLGGWRVLGGSNTKGHYWERTYGGLPMPHNVISFTIRIYPLDSWDAGEDDHFEIWFGSIKIIAWTFEGYDSPYAPDNICGGSHKDLRPMWMYATVPHSTGSVVVRVVSSLNQDSDDESLGFRDIKMEFKQISSPPGGASFCGVTQGNPLATNACPCDAGTYMTPPSSGNCQNCDGTCTTCFAGGSAGCSTCPDGRYKSGNSCPACSTNCQTCTGSAANCQTCPPTQFMVGATCYPTCNPPLEQYMVGTVPFCRSPCSAGVPVWWDKSCGACSYADGYGETFTWSSVIVSSFPQCNYPCSGSQIYSYNNTCFASCPSPLTTLTYRSRSFCTYSCTPKTTQFLYWNGSCIGSCPWPLSPEIQAPATSYPRKFCWYYCDINHFLYWNGSCLPTCPWPLSPETQAASSSFPRKFCWYTCDPAHYLYWNGSCLPTCPWPLSPETQAPSSGFPRKFCWYTCDPTQYLYWNGSCFGACGWPLIPETQGTNPSYLRKFCWYTCDPTHYLYWNGSCLANCPWPLSPETQAPLTAFPRKFCWYYCQPGEFMYWNGTCSSDCIWPLVPETQGTNPAYQRKFCWYLCQPNEFLYWNGSCLNTCPWPLSPETQAPLTAFPRKFCWYYCQPGEYMYWNGSCKANCPLPLSPETQGSIAIYKRQFCWYPCMEYQWLTWDQTCQPSCNSPLVSEMQGTYMKRQFCWYTCPSQSNYLFWNGTCASTCPHPFVGRYQNGQWFCDYPCAATGQFLYWNGSCLSTCDPPLTQVSEGTPVRKLCYYLCGADQYLYWDGTCQATCNFPLTPTTQGSPKRQFCWYLCPAGQFQYWNGSCLTDCPSPFTQATRNSQLFCDYPCAAGSYLLWNGSCSEACPYPMRVRIEGNLIKKNLCDFTCAPSMYLYWNGSCLSTCPSPLSERTEGTSPDERKFCDYPCVGNQFLYWNASCMNKCSPPLVVRTDLDRKYCDYPCPGGQIMYWDGSCTTSCDPPLTLSPEGNPLRDYCKYVCSPTQFLYWNGSCADECSFPLTSYILKGRLFCKNPCLTTEILHFNGSCLSNCPLPLVTRTQSGFSYCDYPCAEGEYLYWNSSCIVGCEAPLVAKTVDGLIYCEFPCSASTDFMYWNGSCSSQCDSPLTQKTEGGKNFCVSGCSTDKFLYWNGSCSSQCNSPLTQTASGDVKFCQYSCDSTSEYLYWDGSCSSQCDLPLIQRTTAGMKYCDYPCSQASMSLYWNGSCLPNCNPPLKRRTENGKQFCDFPCTTATDYLKWDSSCSSSCPTPLVSKTEGTRNFCLNTCDPSDFSYWNGTCFSSCPPPFIQKYDDTYKYCNPPCENNVGYYYEELKTCYSECKQPAYIDSRLGYLRCLPIQSVLAEGSGSIKYMFLNAPLERNTITFVKLVKSMEYVRYLNINMPPRLQRLGVSRGRNVLSVSSGMQMGIGIKGNFIQQLLPVIYGKHQLHSSFLVNYWENLVNLIIAVGFALLFLIMEKVFRAVDLAVPEVICQTLRVLTKWNFVIMAFVITIDDIILFSALEFRSLDGNSSGVSLALAIVFLGLVAGLIGQMIYLVVQKKTKAVAMSEDFQILFNGFKDNNVFCQLFFMLYMLRIGVPMALAVLLEISPVGNTILQVILSSGVMTFLIIFKPFVKKVNHYQILIFEALTLLMNCGILALVILSHNDKHESLLAVILGDLVILGNDAINVMGLFFLILKLHIESKLILTFMKKHEVPKKLAVGLWVQLLYIPLQLSHMGFEEMTVYNVVKHDPSVKEVDFRKGKLGKPKQHELQNEFDHASFDQMKQEASTTNIEILNTDRNHLLELSSYRGERNQETVGDQTERLETFGDNVNDNDMSIEYRPKHYRRRILNVEQTRGREIHHEEQVFETNSNFIQVSDEAELNVNSYLPKQIAPPPPSKGILKSSPRQHQYKNVSENQLDDTVSQVGMNSERSLYNDLDQLVSRNNSEVLNSARFSTPINSSQVPTAVNSRIQVNQNVSEGISASSLKSGEVMIKDIPSLNAGQQVIPEEPMMAEQGSLGITEVNLDEQPSIQLWQAPRKLFKPKKKLGSGK